MLVEARDIMDGSRASPLGFMLLVRRLAPTRIFFGIALTGTSGALLRRALGAGMSERDRAGLIKK